MSTDGPPDPRLHPYRDDLAAEYLRGQIEAPRYVEGTPYRIAVSHLPLRRAPKADAPLDTEGLFGETITVYDDKDGWGWAQLQDGYVGYLEMAGLAEDVPTPTHRLTALRSYLYPKADIKTPPLDLVSMNALLVADGKEGPCLPLATGGYVFARHAKPIETAAEDYVAIAEMFLGTPYLWGGNSDWGIDCSGLAQAALTACGTACPGDSDLQRAAFIFASWACSHETQLMVLKGVGGTPTRKTVLELPEVKAARNRPTSMPNALTFEAVYDKGIHSPNMVLGPKLPKASEYHEIVRVGTQQCISGELSAQEACESIGDELNAMHGV